ncbi:sensor domain-containing diguanylate cyclase [Sulfurimonas sp. SAG-AH-194-C21]|nr:sensor domain-containing diguanylate cyclase [Sulfurimonas sp. SAG-AH-194-C21]MDF1882658.1 sensor domain-containing diguanylate cyclase [Sulfurimonas sp. SAG-AH-194-C21]
MKNLEKYEINEDIFGFSIEIPLKDVHSIRIEKSDIFNLRLGLLFEMTQSMSNSSDDNEVFDIAMDYACRVLQTDRASIAIADESDSYFELFVVHGVKANQPKKILLPISGTAIGNTYKKEVLSYRPDISNAACPALEGLFKSGMNSTMVSSIVSNGIHYGTFNTANSAKDGYTTDDMLLFSHVTVILATHLHRIKLKNKIQEQNLLLEIKNEELRNLATIDSLTGLYNRRYIISEIDKEIQKVERGTALFSLLMLDIDNFKSVNDCFGHNYGDIVLKKVSSKIEEFLRKSDVVSRWGGEEFLVLCSTTTKEEAFVIAEKVRCGIEQVEFKKSNKVTVSIGIAEFNANLSIDALIEKADKCLYEAKTSGKNKSVM